MTQPIEGLAVRRGDPIEVADLRVFPGLADLTDSEIAAFCLVTPGRKLAKDAILFQQGETGEKCFAIVRGAVRVSKDYGGSPMVLDTLGPGTFVGQDALAERTTRSVTAQAAEDTLTIELVREDIQRLLGFHDQVALRLMELIAVTGIRKLRGATKQLAKLLEMRATGVTEDGAAITGTRPLEWLRAAAREWSVRVDEK